MRDYQAAHELNRISRLSAFNIQGATRTRRVNQHETLIDFPDGSRLQLRHTAGRLSCWHPAWTGSAADSALGPIEGVPYSATTRGRAAA